MKKIFTHIVFLLFASQVSSQTVKEDFYGAWSRIEFVTDAESKISINERYLFMSNGIGGYTKEVKKNLNNKRANPAFTISINYSWPIVDDNLKLIFDKESRKTIEANATEEKWQSGAEFWAGLLERKYYNTELAGQILIITFKKQSAIELLLSGNLFQKQ